MYAWNLIYLKCYKQWFDTLTFKAACNFAEKHFFFVGTLNFLVVLFSINKYCLRVSLTDFFVIFADYCITLYFQNTQGLKV